MYDVVVTEKQFLDLFKDNPAYSRLGGADGLLLIYKINHWNREYAFDIDWHDEQMQLFENEAAYLSFVGALPDETLSDVLGSYLDAYVLPNGSILGYKHDKYQPPKPRTINEFKQQGYTQVGPQRPDNW